MEKISQPKILLHIEGGIVLLFSLFMYHYLDGGWRIFFLLLLVPDISLLGYLANDRTGSTSYNLFHFYLTPFVLALSGIFLEKPNLILYGLIWLAHIGMDRVLGLGLKYPEGRKITHFSKL